ncbi:MAG: alpha/beta hydrolase [Caldilineaceae bacterium]|nr:alpha/beta hydrolase [Caldilineaceae bacterium]
MSLSDPLFAAMDNIQSRVVTTDRLRAQVRVNGAPDGMPLLLLHGSHASSRWWLPLMALLPDEIYAVAIDLRGCGGSDKSADGYEIDQQAADVWSIVQALDLRGIDLVAHSSGAAVAVEYALTHQESLSTLTLVDPVPAEGVYTPLDVFLLLEQMQTDRPLHAQAIGAMMPTFDAETRPEDRAFFNRLVDDAQGMAPAAFAGMASALGRWNRFSEVQALTLPTLLIWGDQDEIVNRDEITRTLIAIPGANNLEVLRGVGHSPMVEAPLVLAERIVDFITEDYAEYGAIRDMAEDQSRDE